MIMTWQQITNDKHTYEMHTTAKCTATVQFLNGEWWAMVTDKRISEWGFKHGQGFDCKAAAKAWALQKCQSVTQPST